MPYSAIRSIVIPAVVNTLNLGRSVIMIPLPRAGIEQILTLLRLLVREEALSRRFRIGTTDARKENIGSLLFPITSQMAGASETVSKMLEQLRKESVDGEVLMIQSISLLENMYATETEHLLGRLADRVAMLQQESKDSLMFLMQSDSVLRSRILALSDHYMKMLVRDRSVVVMGEKPSTVAHVLEHDPSNPFLPALIPIV